MVISFYILGKMARQAQMSDGYVMIPWEDVQRLAEHGEALECELENLKRDVEQVRMLRKGLDDMKEIKNV